MRGQKPIEVHLRMRWLDFSPSLHNYTVQRLQSTLRPFASRIRAVHAQITDANGRRHGADDKICEIEVRMRPAGSLMVSAASADVYLSAAVAARRARAIVRDHVIRERDHGERPRLSRIA